jgi:hypothetical protein
MEYRRDYPPHYPSDLYGVLCIRFIRDNTVCYRNMPSKNECKINKISFDLSSTYMRRFLNWPEVLHSYQL